MDDSKGRDMVKVILGIILVFAGNLMTLKMFPRAEASTPAAIVSLNGASMVEQFRMQALQLKQMNEQFGLMEGRMSDYFKFLMLSLCLVNVGAFALYLSGESRKS